MTINVLDDYSRIEAKVVRSIATPYIAYILGDIEIGYCIIDVKGNVKEKYIVSDFNKNIILNPLHLRHLPFNMDMVKNGYFRIWVDNMNYYLKWESDKDNNEITLQPKRIRQ